MVTQRPVCRLCLQPAGEMSNEDVIPEWLRNHQIAGMDDPAQWATLIKRVRTRVCKECNGRMNVAFEQPARAIVISMLEAEPLRLSRADQRAVARWMMKVTLLYGLMRHWRDDVNPAVHPDGAVGWSQPVSQEQHRTDLIRLLDEGVFPDDTTICAIAVAPLVVGRPLVPRTDAHYGGYSTTNLLSLLFEVVTRDHLAARHRATRGADPRWSIIWPLGAAGEPTVWPPRRTSVVEVLKFQEVVSRTAHFMSMGRQRDDNTPAALRRLIEGQGL